MPSGEKPAPHCLFSKQSAGQITLTMPSLHACRCKTRTPSARREVDGEYGLTIRKIAILEEKTL